MAFITYMHCIRSVIYVNDPYDVHSSALIMHIIYIMLVYFDKECMHIYTYKHAELT